jgi:hypothetical protein
LLNRGRLHILFRAEAIPADARRAREPILVCMCGWRESVFARFRPRVHHACMRVRKILPEAFDGRAVEL